jgi:hypothetical protein
MSGRRKFSKKAQANKGKFQAKGGSNIASHSIKKSVNDYNYYLRSAKQAPLFKFLGRIMYQLE